MSPTTINWQVAKANAEELRRLEASVDAHPFARFVYLAFREKRPR
jgi:hypothetical protein